MNPRLLLALAILAAPIAAGDAVTLAKPSLSYNLSASRPWMPLFWGGFSAFTPGTGNNTLTVTLPSGATSADRLTIRAGAGVSFNTSGSRVTINGDELDWSGPVQGTGAVLSVGNLDQLSTGELRQLLTRIYYASTADPVATAGATRAITLNVRGTTATSQLTLSLVNGNVAPMALFGTLNASQTTSGALTLIEAWDDTKTDAELFYFPTGSSVGSFGTGTGASFVPSTLVPVNSTPSFAASTLSTLRFQVVPGYVGTPAWDDVKLLVGEAASPVPAPTWPVPTNVIDDDTVLGVAGPPVLFISLAIQGAGYLDPAPAVDLAINGVTGTVPVTFVAHPLSPTLPSNGSVPIEQVVVVTRQSSAFHVTIDRAKLAQVIPAGTRHCGWVMVLTPTGGTPIRIPMLAMLRWTPRAPG